MPFSLGGPPRVLVHEEGTGLGQRIRSLSGFEAAEVMTAATPHAIHEILAGFPADVLMLSMGQDGDPVEVARSLRELEIGREIPILFLLPEGSSLPSQADFALEPCDPLSGPRPDQELARRLQRLQRLGRLQGQYRRAMRRIQEELDLARSVQRNLLPFPLPERDGLVLAAHYEPSSMVGGDFFDVVPLEGNATGLFLADVVGHGVAAALFTSFLKAHLLHWPVQMQRDDPGETLSDMSEALFKTFTGSGRFVTAVYATYQPGLERILWANAGHPPPLVLPVDGPSTYLDGAEIPLGIDPTVRYTTRSCRFKAGDRVFFYTDGITEQRGGPNRETFGKERLARILDSARDRSLGEAVAVAVHELQVWASGIGVQDDVNILAFEAAPPWDDEEYGTGGQSP